MTFCSCRTARPGRPARRSPKRRFRRRSASPCGARSRFGGKFFLKMRNINGYIPEAAPKALPGKTGRWPVPYLIAPNDPPEEAEITPADYLHTLWRRKWTVGAFLLAGVLAGGVIAYLSPRVYQGQTSIEVQDVNENFLNLKEIDPTATSSNFGNDAYVQTQAQILGQDGLVEQVVKKLNLDQRPHFRERFRLQRSAARRRLSQHPGGGFPGAERGVALARGLAGETMAGSPAKRREGAA